MNIIVRAYVLMLICVAALLPTVMHAQTVCDEDKGITTNPDAAVNTEKPHKRNSNPVIFDWRDSTFIMKPGGDLTTETEIVSPFYNTGIASDNMAHLKDYRDFSPIDGWELIAQRFGRPFDAPDDAFENPIGAPAFILYNRYTGILRVLVAPIRNDLAQFVRVSLKHERVGKDGFPSTLDMAESSIEKPLRALDDYEGDPEFVSVAPFTSNAQEFTYADFPMVYDPCTCGYSSKIKVTARLIEKATINLQGTTSGKIVEIDSDADKDEYDTESSSLSLGLKDIAAAGKKASQTFSDLNKFKEATEKKIEEHFAQQRANNSPLGTDPMERKQAAKSALNTLEDAVASSGFLRTALKAVPYVGAAVDFLSVFIGGGKDPEQPQKVQISPMAIDMTSSFSGTIDAATAFSNYEFFTPGSSEPIGVIVPETIDDEYPYYNEPLGLFNLVETPRAVKIHQPAPASNRWDECGKGASYTQAWGPWTGDVCPGGYKDFDTLLIKLESVPDFAVNFNAGFKRDDIEILGSIVFESDGPIVLDDNLSYIAPSENSIVVSDRIVRTSFLPLGCLPDNPLRFVRRDDCLWKGLNPSGTWTTFPSLCQSRVYLKLLVRLVRSDGSEHSQNVLYVGTFSLSTTKISQNASAYWESPYDGFDENRTISGGVHSTSERVWNRISIGPAALVKSNVPPNPTPELELVAGNEIVVSPGAESGQDVIIEGESHLYIDLPYACTTPVEPISVADLQSFCNSNTYKYNRSFSKEGAGAAGDAVAGHPIDALLTTMPNPASDHVTVRCSHRSTSETVFALYDTFGGLVQTRTVPADRSRNPEVRFDTSRLPSGTYIVVMSTGVTTLSSSIVVYR